MRTSKLSFLSSETIRAALGMAVFLAVVAIAGRSHPVEAGLGASEGRFPDMNGAVAWLNFPPLNGHSLRGKVVLVNFWTYSCINSLRELPYMKAWAAKYKDAGLVVIGVHTPEFGFEKERSNAGNAVRELKVSYPVAIDSNHRIWQAFNNEYWPASYFIDGQGRIRYHHFGEGEYSESERVIQELLKENGATRLDSNTVSISADGIEAAPSGDVRSPETYVGYRLAERFVSPEAIAQDSPREYNPAAMFSLNQWGLGGLWNVGSESAALQGATGKITFRFHARDLHMVLGPTKNGRPIRFSVKLDSGAPGAARGVDCSPDGAGEVREPVSISLSAKRGQ